MKNQELESVFEKYGDEIIKFTGKLVRTRSYSGEEGELARILAEKMQELGYDEVSLDSAGNVIGRMGSGQRIIHFDSHMDTVEVKDGELWAEAPFSGKIVDGRIFGRGSVDMKGGLAASVYAGAMAKELGLLRGKTVYVTGTVDEEYCDGENLKILYAEKGIHPDFVIICEPSDNMIALGHKGKAQFIINTRGVSAHGSAPEKGKNAVYEMAEIIKRVERKNRELSRERTGGTVVLSHISCISASLNAVPSGCSIYLDRRLAPGETLDKARSEMDEFIGGKDAEWEVGTITRASWTGREIIYNPLHEPWEIPREHPLAAACAGAYREAFGKDPEKYDFWDFGTNAVTPVSMGIPTIGFGPGEYKLAHMGDENCEIRKIKDAGRFYTLVIKNL